MDIPVDFDYEEVIWLTSRGNKAGLIEALKKAAAEHGFYRSPETEWAYRRVASFLEDGWTACRYYVEMRSEMIDKRACGQIVNLLIAGTRPDEVDAEQSGARFVFDEGGQGDAAAFFFYVVSKPPELQSA